MRSSPGPSPVALRALAVVSVLGLGGGPQALAQPAEGEKLVEHDDSRRLDCQGAFCIWRQSIYSPCSGEYCYFNTLYVTDREGHVVSEHERSPLGPYTHEVRFIGPRRIEFLDYKGPFRSGREMGIDIGVDQSWVNRQVWKLSSDGKTLTQDLKAVRVPEWKRPPKVSKVSKPPRPSRPPPTEPEKPSLKVPVTEAVLAKAIAACGSEFIFPRHHECHRGTCMLVLDSVEDRENSHRGNLCPVLVKGSQVRKLPLALEAVEFNLTPTTYVFTTWDGPYGSLGSSQDISRTHPDVMLFSGTQGLHVEGGEPYPVREAKSVEAARALAPIVHAYTRAHIPWGRDAWRDESDLALAWQVMRVGENLHLHAEVDDDTVVPFATGTGVHSDHLELTVSRGTSGNFKLGVLLAPEGQLQVRLWQKEEGDKKQYLDEPFVAARGTWRQREHGYEVDLALPVFAIQGPSSPLVSGLSVFVSDADAAGKQETLMGHVGRLFFWSEYPPSHEEYERATSSLD
ncbi:hypothetical protein [Melittangium boletus]|uniref:Uncharacterized protein n=1 Tax=Melittangium boletus DSM 14713 TaxID=1294270 RepID=A0A250IPJ4_9BACT|nr:hypothetical protein [Melittangium boletus]ATB33188.1 hypothetical protein MEBOL_006677 [Melittangium boletus DSM 14713]